MRNYPEESEQRWYSDRYPGERDDRYDGFNAPDPQYEETRSWGGDPAPPAEDPGPYRTQPIERGPRYRQPAGPAVAPMAPPSVGTPPPPPPPAPPVSPGPGAPGPVPGYVAPPSAPPPNIPPPSVPQVPEQAGGAVYRTKRAGVAVLIGAVAAVSELLILAKVLVAAFGSKGTPGTTLAALLALCGVPLVAIGLYALATGAASAATTPGRAWSRVPLAYLPVGLVLLVAAGLAIH